VEAIVQADHFALDVDQQLAPEPLVFARTRPGLEFTAVLGQHAQDVAQGTAFGHFQLDGARTKSGAVGRVGDDVQLHVFS